MNGHETNADIALPRLNELIAQGEALIAARRNPQTASRKFPDFGESYRRWNNAGKELVTCLSAPSDAQDWNAGNCRAMYSLDQEAAYCIGEQDRQQTMLLELRKQFAAGRATETGSAPAQEDFDRLLTTEPKPPEPKPEQLLDDLRRVARSRKLETVSFSEYRLHGRFSVWSIRRQFGSWNNALQEAGLALSRRQVESPEQLLENLARVWKALGRRPVLNDMVKPISDFSVAPYQLRFGGWTRTLKAFAAWARDGKIPTAAVSHSGAPPKLPREPGARMRYNVFKRDHNKCVLCGRSPDTDSNVILHLDHIHPRSRGGKSIPGNLRTLCSKCNIGKGDT